MAKANKAKNILFDLNAMEVSLVPKGKNLKTFLITKEDSSEEDNMNEVLKNLLEGDVVNAEKFESALPETISKEDGKKEAALAMLKMFQGVKKEMSEDFDAVFKAMLTSSDVKVEKESLTDSDMVDALKTKGYNVLKAEEKLDMEKISKEQLEEVKKELKGNYETVVKELTDNNKKLTESLETEKNIRITKEFHGVALDMGYKGEKAEKVGKMLKVSKESMSEEDYKLVEENMKVSAEAMKTIVSKELGHSAEGEKLTGEAKLEKIAKELATSEKISYVDAYEKALDQNPELYGKL